MNKANNISILLGSLISILTIIYSIFEPSSSVIGSTILCSVAMISLCSKYLSKYAGHYFHTKNGVVHTKDVTQTHWLFGVLFGWFLLLPVAYMLIKEALF